MPHTILYDNMKTVLTDRDAYPSSQARNTDLPRWLDWFNRTSNQTGKDYRRTRSVRGETMSANFTCERPIAAVDGHGRE